jgi:hypothetical protein
MGYFNTIYENIHNVNKLYISYRKIQKNKTKLLKKRMAFYTTIPKFPVEKTVCTPELDQNIFQPVLYNETNSNILANLYMEKAKEVVKKQEGALNGFVELNNNRFDISTIRPEKQSEVNIMLAKIKSLNSSKPHDIAKELAAEGIVADHVDRLHFYDVLEGIVKKTNNVARNKRVEMVINLSSKTLMKDFNASLAKTLTNGALTQLEIATWIIVMGRNNLTNAKAKLILPDYFG